MTRATLPSLAALAVYALCSLLPAAAQAEENESSDYSPIAGPPFFVLTDTQYGTGDEALLRVEVSSDRWAVGQYGGIDVALYRVPDPLAFLKAQNNLHRIDVAARPRDEGVANTLAYLWSNAWNKSRRAWRDLFSRQAKRSVVEAAPALKTSPVRPNYQPTVNFEPLAGFELIDRFRYPLMAARPIDPMEKHGVNLAGSSSNFLPKNDGNFHVPLGKLAAGLYVAEAMLGTHRAVTLVFVSDTVAVTKLASGALTVWAAHRVDGRPVSGAALLWSDGRGVLASAQTDANGLATLTHGSPERTYLLGRDAAGGVFVSENFYYDSEIYDTKFYTVTDRPLYRPGDEVGVKFLAREYRAADESAQARQGDLAISVLDPNGAPVWTGSAHLASEQGADTRFALPPDAVAGGYEIRVRYLDKTYGAAFRVAEYVKPHLEIALTPDRADFKTGEPVKGAILLTYPNGDPVKNAAIELTLRAQALTMVQGELRYGGLFPVQLATASLVSDNAGKARFSLPPVKEPSRLVLSILATDGAAYRVRKTQELLIERAAANWRLTSARRFSMPGEPLHFALEPETPDSEKTALPALWEIVRLEDRTTTSGAFDAAARVWSPTLERPGSYSLLLRDGEGRIVAAATHWVGNRDGGGADGVRAIPGTIEMVADKERYQPGETAEVLITFSEPIDEALLTLERDRVETAALLSAAREGAGWVSAERLASGQWRARIPVTEKYAPNVTFSVVYVKNGEYVFQNAGLVVAVPTLSLEIETGRTSVQPGETVTVDVGVALKGKPVRSMLTVSVVDEMIYALQPEIAPDMVEFFQHVRRNNVRTNASLNFITYDEAADYAYDAGRQPPARHRYNERGIKVLERARRDDTDTAAWQPSLVTDENGRARFSFKMPDALSRWRITVRAVALETDAQAGGDGVYGQRAAWIQSDKPLYAKWTSPAWMREGDAPVASVAVFNNTDAARETEIALKLAGREIVRQAVLPHGLTYLSFALPPFSGAHTARLEVREAGKIADALETPVTAEPPHWRGVEERTVALARGAATLDLPADARDLKLRLAANGSEHFLRVADALIDFPWGCVEQTASRLIPLALVTPLLAPDRAQSRSIHLWQTLYGERLRLASLAGPDAVFGWWGRGSGENALMTAYAYYADWRAARTLGIGLPAAHWERVLEVYRDYAAKEPVLHRALALWFIQQMGLPVYTQTEGLLADLTEWRMKKGGPEADVITPAAGSDMTDSPILSEPDSRLGLAYAQVLAALIARQAGLGESRGQAENEALAQAGRLLRASAQPSALALLLLSGESGDGGKSGEIAALLAQATESTPTLDRALALVWTREALGSDFAAAGAAGSAARPADDKWRAVPDTRFGQPEWRWPAGEALPQALEIDPAGGPLTAILRYEREEADENALPVALERNVYRLERRSLENGSANYAAVPIDPAQELSAQELYLDEIVLTSPQTYRYGLVEIPLPPGAAIEPGTWGVNLAEKESDDYRPIERSRAEERRDRYGIPVDRLPAGETIVLRHLLRVGQSGRFVLPPARYYRMYQPAQKAYAKGGNTAWTVK
ncbi:MAG: alpha-2-macroglobulin family protein [Candidatus Accumulibacter sp.]|nr:alpha-2-macroglobulin family protein [Accumulibacter sp.]